MDRVSRHRAGDRRARDVPRLAGAVAFDEIDGKFDSYR